MNSTMKINDVCRITFQDKSALILIDKLCDTHIVGSLIHSYPELATKSDFVVYDICPYPIVVQSGIIGCFWHSQIDSIICSLPKNWQDHSYRGLSMQGAFDSRIVFKSSEIRRLHTFTSDCTGELLKD
jgi:hypothetical protein